MFKDLQFPERGFVSALAVSALLWLTASGADARDKSEQSSGFHQTQPPHSTPPPHNFITTGTMNSFQCGKGSAIFSNVDNQLNILTTVPTDGSCGIAGVQWLNLKGMQLKQVSFDVLGGGCTNDEVFGVFMFLVEPSSTVPTACQSFVQIPLTNGFTRYVIQPSSLTRINSIVIAHLGSNGANANHVIGNFLLNGNQVPFIQLNNLHPCPSQIGCNN